MQLLVYKTVGADVLHVLFWQIFIIFFFSKMTIKYIYNIPIHKAFMYLYKYCGYKSSDYTRGQFLNVANQEVFDKKIKIKK